MSTCLTGTFLQFCLAWNYIYFFYLNGLHSDRPLVGPEVIFPDALSQHGENKFYDPACNLRRVISILEAEAIVKRLVPA
jgi:hypothetical protein